MRNSTIITREIRPALALIADLIEAFCVFLLGKSAPLWIATKRCFRVMNQLGYGTVNLSRIDWIVYKIPVMIQRVAVVRVNRVIRQPMPPITSGLV